MLLTDGDTKWLHAFSASSFSPGHFCEFFSHPPAPYILLSRAVSSAFSLPPGFQQSTPYRLCLESFHPSRPSSRDISSGFSVTPALSPCGPHLSTGSTQGGSWGAQVPGCRLVQHGHHILLPLLQLLCS